MQDGIITDATVQRALAEASPRDNIFDDRLLLLRFEDLLNQEAVNRVFNLLKQELTPSLLKAELMSALSDQRLALYKRMIEQHEFEFVGQPYIEFRSLQELAWGHGYSRTFMEDELNMQCPPANKGPIDVVYYIFRDNYSEWARVRGRDFELRRTFTGQHGCPSRVVYEEEESLRLFWEICIKPKLPPTYDIHIESYLEGIDRTPFEVIYPEEFYLDLKKDMVNEVIDPRLRITLHHCIHPDTRAVFHRLKLRLSPRADPNDTRVQFLFANTWVSICEWEEDIQSCCLPLSLGDVIEDRKDPDQYKRVILPDEE